MNTEKAESVDPKVDYSDSKSLVAKQSSRKTKITVISVLAVALLLGAVVSMAVFLSLSSRKTPTPVRLTEVNLQEGETLTYRVDQKLELREGKVLSGEITALVGVRVLNKTSDEYWFLLKINVTVDKGDLDMKGLQPILTDYFMMRLQISPRPDDVSQGYNRSEESFEVYGHPNCSKEIIHYVYGIVDQLVPAVKRDLYEEVDGEKRDAGSELKPEVPPMFPGAVKMHRKANTSDKNEVFIKNHFGRSDFVNMSTKLDLDLEYFDSVVINKSNGMVKESHAYLSERLNFGAPIHTKRGFDVTSMNITFSSRVSLVETDSLFFDYAAEAKTLNMLVFVKLVLLAPNGNFTIKRKPQFTSSLYNNSTRNSSSRAVAKPARRYRRQRSQLEAIWNIVKKEFKSAPIVFPYELFSTTMLGLPVKGKSKLWLEKPHNQPLTVGVDVSATFGDVFELELVNFKYQGDDIEAGDTTPTVKKWSEKFTKEVWVWYLLLGVEFELKLELQVKINFPAEENKLVPCLFALEIEPDAKAGLSIKGYDSVFALRAGAYGDGTLVDVSLPLKFSYRIDRSIDRRWGLTLSARITGLELEAGIFYQWQRCRIISWRWGFLPIFECKWGDKKVLYPFGKWNALPKVDKEIFATYF